MFFFFYLTPVILKSTHPASFAHNFVWDAKFLFQPVPGSNSIAELSLKLVFWTQKFAVGLIDTGNSESQDQYKPKIVNESL